MKWKPIFIGETREGNLGLPRLIVMILPFILVFGLSYLGHLSVDGKAFWLGIASLFWLLLSFLFFYRNSLSQWFFPSDVFDLQIERTAGLLESEDPNVVNYAYANILDIYIQAITIARWAKVESVIEKFGNTLDQLLRRRARNFELGSAEYAFWNGAQYSDLILHLACEQGIELTKIKSVLGYSEDFIVRELKRLNLHDSYMEGLRKKQEVLEVAYDSLFSLYSESETKANDADFVLALIRNHENQTTELKSSFNTDLKTGQKKSPQIRHAAVKTVAGFMNSIGGHLLIGVDDDQNILGIDGDLKDFSEDKFERGFMDVLQAALEPFDPSIVNTSFHEIDGKVLFLVEVRKSKVVPVYVNMPIIHPDPQIFLRRGAASIALSPKEAVEFITRSKRAKV